MLVYGESNKVENAGAKKAGLTAMLRDVARLPPGLERHAALVDAFIEASELIQGIADAEFEARGFDTRSPAQDAGTGFLVELARTIERSWRSGLQGELSLPTDLTLPFVDDRATILAKSAEGYAFYALYPEAYLEAARRSGLGPRTGIIGIRSIGLGLAAMVAAALGARDPVSVRPVGHPFRREVRVSEELATELTEGHFTSFAVVDEGPGLSGSSFAAVADWLEAHGIRRELIHFFPSHAGPPGPQASSNHRERWDSASRHVVPFDQIILRTTDRERNLRSWVAGLVGPVEGPLEEISGGSWRPRRYQDEKSWPAVNSQQERRKFIVRAKGATWLVKFAGLGRQGARKLQIARLLHDAGFCAEPAGLRHGFLVERWIEDASSLDQRPVERTRLIEQVGAYVGFRARELPAAEGGASLSELRRMALHNTREAMGEPAAQALERRLENCDALEGKVRRVRTDNRMHAHEWLVVGGKLIKTDALDHHAGHDLVGCQDPAWDVAGAVSEMGLSSAETDALCARIEKASGWSADPELVGFLLPCYLAFQLGACVMAVQAVDEAESRRLQIAAARYRLQLAAL